MGHRRVLRIAGVLTGLVAVGASGGVSPQEFNLASVVIHADWLPAPRVIDDQAAARCVWGLLYSLRGERVHRSDYLPADHVMTLEFHTPGDWRAQKRNLPERLRSGAGSGRVRLLLDADGGPPQMEYERDPHPRSARWRLGHGVEEALAVFGIATRVNRNQAVLVGYTQADVPCERPSDT